MSGTVRGMGTHPDEARGTLHGLVTLGLLLDIRQRLIRMENRMAEDTSALGVELDKIETEDTAEADAITRVEADIAALKAQQATGVLSPDEAARLAALKNEIAAHAARLNAAADAAEGAPTGTVVSTPVDVPADTPADASTPNDGTDGAGPVA